MPPADRDPPLPNAIVRAIDEAVATARDAGWRGSDECTAALDALDTAIRAALAEARAAGRDAGLEEAAGIASDNGSLDIYGEPLAPFLRARKRAKR